MSDPQNRASIGRLGSRDAMFGDLMEFRVREILLVSSLYDSYVLEEDGLLAESLDVEYSQLNLSAAPRIARVPTGDEAIEFLSGHSIDLVITMPRLGDMDLRRFGQEVKRRQGGLPVIVLSSNPAEAARLKEMDFGEAIDQIFIWRGDFRLFLAIVKHVEDLRNAERDMALAGVRGIVLIENSVRFYSSYLPLLYTELMRQTQRVMADRVNATQRRRRMRARPKIFLAETFEEAWDLVTRYRDHLLGIISDARFPRDGRSDPEAGFEFVRRVKKLDPDMPILIQSSEDDLESRAHALGAAFVKKRSPRLLDELRSFIQTSLGFGDFVFQMPDGSEVERVREIAGMPAALRKVPDASLRHHAARNHFSNWCMARTEFDLAERLRPVRVSEFDHIDELRAYLIEAFDRLRSETQKGVIAEFSRSDLDDTGGFARIGTGSLGGKGRGLGFINALLAEGAMPAEFEGIRIFVPPSVVLATDIFDEFMRRNALEGIALSDASDEEITRAFLQGSFPASLDSDLLSFLARIREPLAVRSSSLLEDSHERPFAGIYRTVMLPNADPDEGARLASLRAAIQHVYASTFFRGAKAYIQGSLHRAEEEKMAVVLQPLAGRPHDEFYYPDFAGAACSYNYYPVLGTTAEDGVALVALGLGRTVLEGGRSVRFSPGRPRSMPQFSSTADIVANAQRRFYALDRSADPVALRADPDRALVHLDLDAAEAHGTLSRVASTYSRENDAVYDGTSRPGVRLVTFARILKGESFPLAGLLRHFLDLGRRTMSCPVEIEYAANLNGPGGCPPEFAFLQIRPMVVETGAADIQGILGREEPERILCYSTRALGHGRVREIRDIVYVSPDRFDRSKTEQIAREVGELNDRLSAEDRPYLLIGPGRWGTSDPWLGIPVEWRQIDRAGVIIELELEEVPLTPSEGTHFFQNLTSFGIGYFSVLRSDDRSFVDFDWLRSIPAARESFCLRHLHLPEPVDVWVDGRSGQGVILKRV